MEQYNLQRFIKAQSDWFEAAYYELSNGKKETHWMWFIFPQIFGLGKSETAIYYSLRDINEAKAYMENEILRERLLCLVNVLIDLDINDPVQIFGYTDSRKLWSCMTLFNQVCPKEKKFVDVINKFYNGKFDANTLGILEWQKVK